MLSLGRSLLEFQRIPVFAAVQLLLNCIICTHMRIVKIYWIHKSATKCGRDVLMRFFLASPPHSPVGALSLSTDLNYWNCWNILFYARQQRREQRSKILIFYCFVAWPMLFVLAVHSIEWTIKFFFLVFAMLAGQSSRCAQRRNDRVSTIRPRASSQPQFLLAQLWSPTVYCVSIYLLAKNHYFPLEIMISPIIFRSLTLRIIHYILTVLFFLLRQKIVVSRFSLLRCVELTAWPATVLSDDSDNDVAERLSPECVSSHIAMSCAQWVSSLSSQMRWCERELSCLSYVDVVRLWRVIGSERRLFFFFLSFFFVFYFYHIT